MLSKEDKIKVVELKAQIKENAANARTDRTEARKILTEARALRKDTPEALKNLSAADKLTRKAVQLREGTKDIGQRECFLAYGYLRGRKYKQLEATTNTGDWDMRGVLSGAANAAGVYSDHLKTWWKEDVTRFDIEIPEETTEGTELEAASAG